MKARGASKPAAFTGYQKLVVAMLAFLQFTVSLDFMILSPMGPIVMPALGIDAKHFGLVVSAYALAAGVSGILTAGFSDHFDRKRFLLALYAGFLVGTFLCGIAPNYPLLLLARVVAGLFGGVIAATSFSIVADLFPASARGRAFGVVQSAFGASQVMGIPIGLFLANRIGWNGPFLLIATIGIVAGVVIALKLRPVRAHLEGGKRKNAASHLWHTATEHRYLPAYVATMFTAIGAFMLQPFASNFSVHNVGVPLPRLPFLFMAAGIVGMLVGPLAGRLSDRIGAFRVVVGATMLGACILVWWSHLGLSPLWLALLGNCLHFAMINSRIVSTMALVSNLPSSRDRGAYMSVSSSLQQLAGAIGAAVAGMVVIQEPSGRIANYPTLAGIVIAAWFLTLWQLRTVDRATAHPAVEGC